MKDAIVADIQRSLLALHVTLFGSVVLWSQEPAVHSPDIGVPEAIGWIILFVGLAFGGASYLLRNTA